MFPLKATFFSRIHSANRLYYRSHIVKLILLISLFCTNPDDAHAQLFTISPDSVHVSGSTDDLFLEAHTTLVNLQDTVINVGWKRAILSSPPEWYNFLCSDFLCYLPESDSGNIYMLPGQEMDVNMTFFPEDVAGESVVRISFFDTSDVSGSLVQIMYSCHANVSTSIHDQSLQTPSIYPNPVSDQLNISNVSKSCHTAIHDAKGRFVIHSFGSTVDVGDLPPGMYYLIMKENGRVRALAFVKT